MVSRTNNLITNHVAGQSDTQKNLKILNHGWPNQPNKKKAKLQIFMFIDLENLAIVRVEN